MKVLFLPTNTSGVAFWRMYQFFRKMREKGVDAMIYRYDEKSLVMSDWEHQFHSNKEIRSEVYGFMQYADVSVVQYVHTPTILAVINMFQGRFNKKILAEIDDEVIDTPSYNPAFKGGFTPGNQFEKVILEHMRISDGVITSTDFLKSCYDRYNNDITTIPNCIDFNKWKSGKLKHKIIRIGWIGGGNHDEDLRVCEEIIPPLLAKYKNIEFYFVHGIPNYLKDMGDRVKYCREWKNISDYPEWMNSFQFDIGIAPLDINKFNMAKSNLRFLEYSALKIPCVATNIEPYARSIKHGNTGFLCNSTQEWIDSLSTLIENKRLRKEVGENANDFVYDKFNLDVVTDKYIKTLKRFAK